MERDAAKMRLCRHDLTLTIGRADLRYSPRSRMEWASTMLQDSSCLHGKQVEQPNDLETLTRKFPVIQVSRNADVYRLQRSEGQISKIQYIPMQVHSIMISINSTLKDIKFRF